MPITTMDVPSLLVDHIKAFLAGADDPFEAVNALRDVIHRAAPNKAQPVDFVRWVPRSMVQPNDYNPNSDRKSVV